ncbi:MAG: sulfotransferase [Anaerolineae bacterium]
MTTPPWFETWRHATDLLGSRTVFFVLGCQKSGTTWVQRLLDACPGVRCGAESHLGSLLAGHLAAAVERYNDRQQQRDLAAHRILLARQDLLGMLRSTGDAILGRLLADLDHPQAILALGDKTPEHALTIPLLDEIYPRARFIHVIRDGRDAAVSGWRHLQRQGKAGTFASFAAYAAYFAEHHWRRYITEARAGGTVHGDRFLEVRYERLHADPAGQVRRMLAHLGLPADEETTSRAVSEASFERLTGGRTPGQEDPASFFRKGAVGDWRAHFDAPALDAFTAAAGPLLDDLGYETGSPPPDPRTHPPTHPPTHPRTHPPSEPNPQLTHDDHHRPAPART